ncbi:hypothetical protein L6452_31754 [Arctium lappa]|uniref:Uncharacterized protein n=1 Tax=Arctium lappa TaxID=4217 RepID=A0ACB8Z3B8_ARCLA|nr:hypothetical protein L6452_31754 [Arctium lappa]
MHKKCIELRPTINHHIHPLHPLTLVNHGNLEWTCDACRKEGQVGGFSYYYIQCDFDACTKCSAAIARKEEALIKFQHEGHPEHTLTLQSRSASFLCDACHSKDEAYFINAKTMISGSIRPVNALGTYMVEEHANDFPQFPMSYAFTDPLKLLQLKNMALDDDSTTEINHWSYDHPLIFNVVSQGVSDDNDEKKQVICCYGCREPILGGFAYGCTSCSHFLHEKCANLAPVINHHLHPLHPLMLGARNSNKWSCDVCYSQEQVKRPKGFSYRCSSCDFDACTKCGLAIALKEEALIEFKHEGHPQHTLTLQLRSASFRCDACQAKDEDLFYQCNSCDFWMHKTCASLAPTIDLPHHPNHPLVLVYSLPDNFYNFKYYCTTPVEENVNEFLHFPMSEPFTDPLKLLHLEKVSLDDDGATEISHWSHDHPLILNVEPQGNNMSNNGCGDPIELCDGCTRPLSLPYYNCKHGCSFTVHKYCAELPLTLEHHLHPDHSLDLVNTYGDKYYYKCNGCFSRGNNFVYKCDTCKFYLDVNCANLPNTIIHKSHKHPLIQLFKLIAPEIHNVFTSLANSYYSTISFNLGHAQILTLRIFGSHDDGNTIESTG